MGGLEVRKVVVVPHPTTNCLHTGWLEGDTESMVVVVGCRDQDASITILSTTLPTRLLDLAVKDGATRVVEGLGENMEDSRQRRAAYNDDYEDFDDYGLSFELPDDPFITALDGDIELPKSVEYKIRLVYDLRLFQYFNYDHSAAKEWVEQVVELTRPRLAALDIPVKLRVIGEPQFVKESVAITTRDNLRLSHKFFVKDDFVTVSLFTETLSHGTHGIAGVGLGCRAPSYDGAPLQPTALSSLWTKEDRDFHAASTHAHELGHTLGLR